MRTDLLLEHAWLHRITRREAVGLSAKAGSVGALAGLGLGAQSASARGVERFSDDMFDVQAVLDGAWDDTAFYRRGDQRGTLREVTPNKTREAIALLDGGKPVVTYNLGEPMFNGFPAFPSSPPRVYDQRLLVLGYEPPPGYDGILQSPDPLGPNRVSAHEERFNPNYSYQVGTQLDNLNHIGVGPVYYGGYRGPDIARDVGHEQARQRAHGPDRDARDPARRARPQARPGRDRRARDRPRRRAPPGGVYRITLEELEAAMGRARIRQIKRGDVNPDSNRLEPAARAARREVLDVGHGSRASTSGEAPCVARVLHRPAIVGADNWALEVVGDPVSGGTSSPCTKS